MQEKNMSASRHNRNKKACRPGPLRRIRVDGVNTLETDKTCQRTTALCFINHNFQYIYITLLYSILIRIMNTLQCHYQSILTMGDDYDGHLNIIEFSK